MRRDVSGGFARILTWVFTAACMTLTTAELHAKSDILGPSGSATFGDMVQALPNGNFVVVDKTGVGAAYLLSPSGMIISSLKGTTDGDLSAVQIVVLKQGNFLVASSSWNNGGAVSGAGSVTWVNGNTGFPGGAAVISAANSLVGLHSGDQVGQYVKALAGGNYIIVSPNWHRDMGGPSPIEMAGAITWGPGDIPMVGAVSTGNSLVGSSAFDAKFVDQDSIVELPSGDVIVVFSMWDDIDHLGTTDAGAVTWINGSRRPASGPISSRTSLVGVDKDFVGAIPNSSHARITALTDGNYTVSSPFWGGGKGAVTWCQGGRAAVGSVSQYNSWIGVASQSASTGGDYVGLDNGQNGVAALAGGNYLIASPLWNNGALKNVGAITWVIGGRSTNSEIRSSNSLVGTSSLDEIGSYHTVLTNGNAVVYSPGWNQHTGAATWISALGHDTTGADITHGVSVSLTNSLVAPSPGENLGGLGGSDFQAGVVALGNGNYVVRCPLCASQFGAAIWGDGTDGSVVGPVSTTNAVYGQTSGDHVGIWVTPLSNGNFVVGSPNWQSSSTNVGAVTWVNGTTGIPHDGNRAVSSANSLVGTTNGDAVGSEGAVALANGNYIVVSGEWNNRAGAVTWGSGISGAVGSVTAQNSFVGSAADDHIGASVLSGFQNSVLALANGHYVVGSPAWSLDAMHPAVGAVTVGNGNVGSSGRLSTANSLIGTDNAQIGMMVSGGEQDIVAISKDNYVVYSPHLATCPPGMGCIAETGAISVAYSNSPTVAAMHSDIDTVVGLVANSVLVWSYNAAMDQLIVGRPKENRVTLIDISIFKDGFGN